MNRLLSTLVLVLHLLFLIGSIRAAQQPNPQKLEPWHDEPQPRPTSDIIYSSIPQPDEWPLARLSMAEVHADTPPRQSQLARNAAFYSKTCALDRERLLGRIEVQTNATPAGSRDSVQITIQALRSGRDFETITTAAILPGSHHIITFPGAYASALRILMPVQDGSADLITNIQIAEIQLTAATRIMLCGDSITNGSFAEDGIGYRKALYDQLVKEGVSIDYVGGLGTPPYEGHFQGGRKTFDFYPGNLGGTARLDVTADMDNYRPHVIGIHLGTNNLGDIGDAPVGPYGTPSQFNDTPSGQMATLVNYLLRWHNGTRGTELQHIFVSLIAPIKYEESLTVKYNCEIARVVRDFQNGVITGSPEPVHIVDQYTPFYEDPQYFRGNYSKYSYDRLHPNTAGHALIASTYYAALKPVLTSQPRWFTDITWETGTAGQDDQFSHHGIAIADINNDGKIDIYTTRAANSAFNQRDFFYQSSNTHVYDEKSQTIGIHDAGASRGALFIDIDRDGDLDLINGNSPGRNRLYENLGTGTFRDITTSSGLENVDGTTTALLAFDMEGDGDLDLYAVNSRDINELYLNDGRGHFSRVDRGANDVVESKIASMSATAADYDQDGDIDIYIAKRDAANVLFVNNGNGYFTSGAQAAGIALNHRSNSAVWHDLDNDADLDLLVSVSDTPVDPKPVLHVYKNLGNGTFQDMSASLNIPMNGYSPLVGDFDNDGDIDLITTFEADRGALYRNNGNWQFAAAANTGAEIYAGDLRGASVFDYEGDGDLDFYAVRSDIFNVFKKNTLANGNHFLSVQLQEPAGMSVVHGSKIWCYEAGRLGDATALVGFREVMAANGHTSQSPVTQHFGMGNRTSCDLLVQFMNGTLVAQRGVNTGQLVTIQPQITAAQAGEPANVLAYSGHNQTDTVGQILPEAVVARVVDAQNLPVPGARVDFSVIQGDATLLLSGSNGDNRHLWLEMETGGLSGGLRWCYDLSCSGGGMVLRPPQVKEGGADTLQFTLAAGNQFSVWARVSNRGASTPISVQMDYNGVQNFSLSQSASWQWQRIGAAGVWAFGPGTHRLTLNWASPDIQIDRLLLTSDPSYIPSGLGEQDSEDPYLTDSQGLAQRRVKLGARAGSITVQARLAVNGQIKTAQFPVQAKPGPVAKIEEISGNHQPGAQPGIPLPMPFVVRLSDAFNNPTPGQRATFTVKAGGGTLTPADGIVTTNDLGNAQATLTPGRSAATQQVNAEADHASGSPIVFETTVSGVADKIVYVQGGGQSDSVNAVLALPVICKIVQEDGQVVAGYTVAVTAMNGGKISTSPAVGADSVLNISSAGDGMVRFYWRLGARAGEQFLRMDASGLKQSPVVLRAVASPASAYRILAVEGDNQTGIIGSKLAKAFAVRIIDRYGNAVPGQDILFKVTSGNGSLNGANQMQFSTVSDTAGVAKAAFTLGTLAGINAYEVQASASFNNTPLTGSPVSFWASATAGPPAFIFAVSGERQTGVVGTALPQALAVAVKDFYQNSVTGHAVQFSVIQGDGQLNDQSQATILTNSQGIAEVQFKLGTHAGNEWHQVAAQAAGLSTETVLFSATATADVPAQLVYVSGNHQSGQPFGQLPMPMIVQVNDRFANPIAGHPVLYEVIKGGGAFGKSSTLSLTTEADGRARGFLILGAHVGDSVNVVRVSAQKNNSLPLDQSPILFYANGLTSDPARLWPVTSPYETLVGTAGKELTAPVVVRVLDDGGRGVPGIPVQFSLAVGSGQLAPEKTTSKTVLSDSLGEAGVRWLLGSTTTPQQLTVSAFHNGKALGNSPIVYNALALTAIVQRMELLSGDGQTGSVNEFLTAPLRVRLSDAMDEPVQGHPVQFRIYKGGGRLGNAQDTVVTVTSNRDGEAELRWRLGTAAGDSAQAVIINCWQEGKVHANGSPHIVYAIASPLAPEAHHTLFSCDSPVPADGASASRVTVVIRDVYDNPIPNYGVRLVTSGLSANVSPLQGLTDSRGSFQASALSAQPGALTLQVQDASSNEYLSTAQTIEFIVPAASVVELVTGEGQSAPVTTLLPQPLTIRVKDEFGRGLSGAEVQFTVLHGTADLVLPAGLDVEKESGVKLSLAAATVLTDGEGLAGVQVRLGTQSGDIEIQSMLVAYPEKKINFRCKSLPAAAAELKAIHGSGQTGTTSHRLSQPLRVQVCDQYGNGVPGEEVAFSSSQPQSYFTPAAVVSTDSSGTAAVFWYLGTEMGIQQAQAAKTGLNNSPVLFTATALANHAPELTLPDSVLIAENENWSLRVQASDLEGDSLFIEAVILPAGAVMDESFRLSWRPGYDQAGRYTIRISARDVYGAQQTRNLLIVVRNSNRTPQIDVLACQPREQDNIKIEKPGYVDFSVAVSDPDGDALSFIWYVNGAIYAIGKPQYRLFSETLPPGDITIKVQVSDQQSAVDHAWTLKVVSAIWLAEFRANPDPAKGIVLSWQTRLETDNLGFYVQRSQHRDGPFIAISGLIAPSASGRYQYSDAKIETGLLYYYRLQDLSANGDLSHHEAISAMQAPPADFYLSAAYPNPFNARTHMRVCLPRTVAVQIVVTDLLGRSLKEIHRGALKPGYYDFTWNGEDEEGVAVASGVYYFRIQAGTEQWSRKMALIR